MSCLVSYCQCDWFMHQTAC
uniref:Uncharacterized protein n=1 Tax=Anguilla anguilla TaxID=7936 RepID=A0A0E9SEU5_ANGAN